MKNTWYLLIAIGTSILIYGTSFSRIKQPKEILKGIKEKILSLQLASKEFVRALDEYDSCIERECAQEIKAMIKAVREDDQVSFDDSVLKKATLSARRNARKAFEQCRTNKCTKNKEKLDRVGRKVRLKAAAAAVIWLGIMATGATMWGWAQHEMHKIKKEEIPKAIKQYHLKDTSFNRDLLSKAIDKNFTNLKGQSLSLNLIEAVGKFSSKKWRPLNAEELEAFKKQYNIVELPEE